MGTATLTADKFLPDINAIVTSVKNFFVSIGTAVSSAFTSALAWVKTLLAKPLVWLGLTPATGPLQPPPAITAFPVVAPPTVVTPAHPFGMPHANPFRVTVPDRGDAAKEVGDAMKETNESFLQQLEHRLTEALHTALAGIKIQMDGRTVGSIVSGIMTKEHNHPPADSGQLDTLMAPYYPGMQY
jgi:hypothetical protein